MIMNNKSMNLFESLVQTSEGFFQSSFKEELRLGMNIHIS